MCLHDWSEITTASEQDAGLRRYICVCDGCDAEMTDPQTN